MLPVRPELAKPERLSGDILAVVGFGLSADQGIAIPIRQLGGDGRVEVWRSPLPVTRGTCGQVAYSANESVLIGAIRGSAGDTQALTAQMYEQVLRTAQCAHYPHLLRIWNHVGDINGSEGELERYRRFSIGRHEALTRFGYAREQFPAACALGMPGEGITIYFLASRERGLQVENPRQIAAYDYPPRYGPRSPSFSRATVADSMIFVSGTASVVGHETLHAGDIDGQLEETLRNLESIVRTAGGAALDDYTFAKIYLRRAADYERVAPRVAAALPRAQRLFLEADICRSDLLIEIEGVAAL